MSILNDDLRALGFIPVGMPFEGAEAWTAWNLPEPGALVYERYYELVKQAMFAQVDLPVRKRIGFRPLTAKTLMVEIGAIVDCWRSAAAVAPNF